MTAVTASRWCMAMHSPALCHALPAAVTASAPAGLATTTEDDFLFFINGQYMEHDALEIQQAGSSMYLKVDTDSIGYDLENDDEILAWGKFNS